MTRNGDWIQTSSGAQFWPMDPRPDEIRIMDIAHALSMQCRFAGHCIRFYSVAEHCVHLARAVSPENALWALLHDASEAYLVDVPKPVKPYLAGYVEAEERLMRDIAERFGLPPSVPDEVKDADRRILTDEADQNMAYCFTRWTDMPPPLGVTLELWTPREAESRFLETYFELVEVEA